MEEIYTWIKNILVYMIINTIVMNLLGNKSYKKYVSIVSGMILVLIVISPVIRLMKLEDNLDYYLQANEYSVEASDFQNDLAHMEEEQSTAVFAEYREKIRTQVEQLLSEEAVTLETFEVILDQDPSSPSFGEIKSMKLTAVMEGDEEGAENGSRTVEDIEAIRILIKDPDENADEQVPSPMEIRIKNKLSDFYNIEQGNININVQGE
jgi:stage III sporulation protein AF